MENSIYVQYKKFIYCITLAALGLYCKSLLLSCIIYHQKIIKAHTPQLKPLSIAELNLSLTYVRLD